MTCASKSFFNVLNNLIFDCVWVLFCYNEVGVFDFLNYFL